MCPPGMGVGEVSPGWSIIPQSSGPSDRNAAGRLSSKVFDPDAPFKQEQHNVEMSNIYITDKCTSNVYSGLNYKRK